MLDYINEDAFQNLAHHKINYHRRFTFEDDLNLFKNNAIIYCHTGWLDQLLSKLVGKDNKYIIITHGSDWDIDEGRFNRRSSSVIKWFAENVTYEHEDLIPIPVGLSPEYNQEFIDRNKFFADNIEIFKSNEKNEDVLYCSWNVATNVKKRTKVIPKLSMKYIYEYGNTIEEYYRRMSMYKYIVSPQGNGMDCNRTWEALYMGCIPIVEKNLFYNQFSDLPILQVNDYSEVTPELLKNFSKREFNYEKLYMTYWKNRIMEEFNKL